MSLKVVRECHVSCDNEGCDNKEVVTFSRGQPAFLIVGDLMRCGWVFKKNGKTYCPGCKKYRRPKKEKPEE